ncbi:MAG TPA: hypothetical protein VI454_16265 [Verrucomicrobiae bacterium]|jgi:hypothetical protein
MFARIGHLLLALALLGATGGHWAVLQSVAWTTMIAEKARSAPLTDAVTRTLSGSEPCQLCKQIAAGKQTEKKTNLPLQLAKLEFVLSAAKARIFPPALPNEPVFEPALFVGRTDAPPIPPPRLTAA